MSKQETVSLAEYESCRVAWNKQREEIARQREQLAEAQQDIEENDHYAGLYHKAADRLVAAEAKLTELRTALEQVVHTRRVIYVGTTRVEYRLTLPWEMAEQFEAVLRTESAGPCTCGIMGEGADPAEHVGSCPKAPESKGDYIRRTARPSPSPGMMVTEAHMKAARLGPYASIPNATASPPNMPTESTGEGKA